MSTLPARNSKRPSAPSLIMKLAWFIVLVFTCLLAALIAYGVRDRLDRRHSIAASNYVAEAERALQEYRADHGAFPEGDTRAITIALMGLETNTRDYLAQKRRHTPNKTLQDPWNQDMRIQIVGDQALVTSAGFDGIFDTADDIDSSDFLALKPYPPLEKPDPTADE